jgi:TrmH family RNA methyltransferase
VVIELLVADGAAERYPDLLETAGRAAVRVSKAAAAAVAEVSDAVTPQGIVAICHAMDVPLTDALAGSPRLVVLCDQVRDPGNLGTVIRCADAFGADAVLVSRDSVDLYNAKTIRASTGSVFHLPVTVEVDLADAVGQARDVGMQVFGADAAAPCLIDELARSGELARSVLWVLGNEARGLPAARAAQLDRLVGLPMYGRAESLNLSTAAAVLLYATASAQRAASEP